MNIVPRQVRILEDAPKPVVVETRKRHPITVKPKTTIIDFATTAAIASTIKKTSGQPKSDHEKVLEMVSTGQYEAAAKLAAKLINSDNDIGFFIHGGSDEFSLVDAWFKGRVRAAAQNKISEFCPLTPELAQILLLKNKGNRRVNSANLGGIMRDMASSRWAANGETIIVSKDGLLNDGQHRCFAALITGASVETAIVFGVDRETMATIDIGRKRTGADRLGLSGVQNYVPMSAISNLILEMKNGRLPTPAETDEFFYANRELVEAANSAAGSNMKGIGPSAAGAACAYLIAAGYRQAEIAEFFVAIRSGEMMPKRDPRMVLHKSIFDARFKLKLSRDNWVRAFVAHFISHKAGKTTASVVWDITLAWGI